LVSGSDKGVVILWDVATGKISGSPLVAHSADIRNISFAPNGKTFATSSDDNTAALWDYTNRRLLGLYSGAHSGSVTGVAFSPDGNLLATVGDDRKMILWDNNLENWQRLSCQRVNRNLTQTEWKQFFGEVPYHTTCPELSQGS
jgi:WD40 repeat protein